MILNMMLLRRAKTYPENCILLVDTYNVLKSGIPNAIKVFNEVLKPLNIRPKGVRIDSGDITYLSKKVRKMLDDAGYEDVKITISNSLDEYIIKSVLDNGAKIDSFGVGERLITARSEPVFGGVYKLVAVENEGKIVPKIKISENAEKITNPGFKQVYRIFDKNSHKAIADLIALGDEIVDENKSLTIFNPVYTWKRKKLHRFYVKPLLSPIFVKGELVYENPSTLEIRDYCKEQLATLWPEVRRLENPHTYYVDLSKKLWDLKESMLTEFADTLDNEE